MTGLYRTHPQPACSFEGLVRANLVEQPIEEAA